MISLVYSLGGVILLEIAAFFLLYRYTRWQGKHVALVVAVTIVGLYLPIGILTWRSLDYFAIHFAFYVMIPYVLGIITTHWEVRREEAGSSAKQQFFHWGPATLVAFFVALAVVDALIISVAEKGVSGGLAQRLLPEPKSQGSIASMFPGSVSHDYQEKEAQYNNYKQRREQQQQLGWQVRKGWVGKAVAGKQALFKVAVVDKQGDAVTGASISGTFLRPSDSRLDQTFVMKETDAGIYKTNITLEHPGAWSLVFEIKRDTDSYEVRAATRVTAPSH